MTNKTNLGHKSSFTIWRLLGEIGGGNQGTQTVTERWHEIKGDIY